MAEETGSGGAAGGVALSQPLGQDVSSTSTPSVHNSAKGPAKGSDPKSNSTSRTAASKKRHHCRYFGSKAGCRAGDQCRFIHDSNRSVERGLKHEHAKAKSLTKSEESTRERTPQKHDSVDASHTDSDQANEDRQYQAAPVDNSRVVPKPVSQAQRSNPREFQIQQLRRRFSPTEQSQADGTSLSFQLVPSDPDFPYEITALQCSLHVPNAYPSQTRPVIKISNQDIPRGHRINVERGFDGLSDKMPHATLLALVNALDRNLEAFLLEERASTIKLVPNAVTSIETAPAPMIPGVSTTKTASLPIEPSSEVPSIEQKAQAQRRRDVETRQLEARLGRHALFARAGNGVTFTIPLEPRRRGDLPVPLQPITTVKLIVPHLYYLEPCRIELQGVSREATHTTEQSFAKRAKDHPEVSLMGHINYLSQNIHTMAIAAVEDPQPVEVPEMSQLHINQDLHGPASLSSHAEFSTTDDKPHIKVIPRPPEWADGGSESDEDSEESDYDSEDVPEEDDMTNPASQSVDHTESKRSERGTALSFPFIELYGIELLELVSLSITIKCERCKQTLDIANLRHNAKGDASGFKIESCSKCASPLSIGYRREFVHANSVRAGFLDLEGCVVVDLLPSTFIPTCAECSTPYQAPGIVTVRGASAMAVCRECHKKMSLKIPEVKFLFVSSVNERSSRALPRKKARENLGIVGGQELPRRGRCSHYAKSYRWFRFSCCSKVFACDRCHDAASEHPNEHANRMICGYCEYYPLCTVHGPCDLPGRRPGCERRLLPIYGSDIDIYEQVRESKTIGPKTVAFVTRY